MLYQIQKQIEIEQFNLYKKQEHSLNSPFIKSSRSSRDSQLRFLRKILVMEGGFGLSNSIRKSVSLKNQEKVQNIKQRMVICDIILKLKF